MANNLFFSRDTRVLVEADSAVWEIPVLDGFSFSQGTNTSEITLNEMAAASGNASRRGRRMFNDSYAPAEWSFSTYMRPFISVVDSSLGWDGTSVQMHAVEEIMWASLISAGTFTAGGDSSNSSWNATSGIAQSNSALAFDFSDSNVAALKEINIYFVMGQGAYNASTHQVYKIEACAVNSAAIDFDIDGIATINWSGFGKLITDHASLPTVTIAEAIDSTNNFIRNRLTTLAVSATATGSIVSAYTLTLTGGSIEFNNNITYLTPETLGVINKPIAHVTGTRSISGAFTCYLGNHSAGSADLFEDLIESDGTITNDFDLTFSIGGASAPKVAINLPTCHLEIPTHSIDDIISLETNFHALPSTVDGADDATITYTGAAY
tara:strand:+ start:3916 stop:5055 length:1140 start_codon:yes stop_codon:yes gene_type:complete